MRPKKKVALSAGKGGYSLKNKYLKKANKQSRAWLTYSAAAYINNLKWPSDLDFIYFSISASLHVLESVRWWIALITTCSSIGFGARTVYGGAVSRVTGNITWNKNTWRKPCQLPTLRIIYFSWNGGRLGFNFYFRQAPSFRVRSIKN